MASSPSTLATGDVRNSPAKQVAVTASMIVCLLGFAVGFGLLGTRVEASSGGALAAGSTLITPATNAFSIWSVIYTGLLAYIVWQWLPAQSRDERAGSIAWLASASLVLNAAWIATTQLPGVPVLASLWIGVAVIMALVVIGAKLVETLSARPARTLAEKIVVDGSFGLYLGWLAVASCGNVAVALVASGVSFGAADPILAVLVLAVAAGLGVVFALRYRGRWAVAAAMAWGLGWVGYARLATDPRSVPVAVAAIVAAAVVVGAAGWARRPAA